LKLKKRIKNFFCILYFLQNPRFCSLISVFLLFCSRDLSESPDISADLRGIHDSFLIVNMRYPLSVSFIIEESDAA